MIWYRTWGGEKLKPKLSMIYQIDEINAEMCCEIDDLKKAYLVGLYRGGSASFYVSYFSNPSDIKLVKTYI